MKKRFYLPGVLLMMLMPYVSEAGTSSSTLIITGTVHDNYCTVNDALSNFDVDLMNNATKQFNYVGATSAPVLFQIVFSSCGNKAKGVKVRFAGDADPNNSFLLKPDNTITSSASGVGIEILDWQHKVIPLNATFSMIEWIDLTPNDRNTLTFYARLMATSTPVTPGKIKADAVFTMEFL